jgi:uncharacterized membrane protein
MDHKDERTLGDRISDSVAKFGGSWRFIICAVILIKIWVALNLLSPIAWDSYPFILLNLLLSLVAALQAPFILMSQRRVEMKQDAIYRSLFREIKELIEVDLSLEHQVLESNKEIREKLEALQKSHEERG